MKPKHINASQVSVSAAIASGDAFRDHAEAFCRLVEADSGAADRVAKKDIGELIVSATSLALALEIYLKALLLVLGQPAPTIHNLEQLLNLVPKKQRQAIEAAYNKRRASEQPEDTSGVSLHIVHHGGEFPPFERPGPLSMNLSPLLRRNASAFMTWRYLFAHGPTKSGEPLSYEYVRLRFAADAIRGAILHNHSPSGVHLGVANPQVNAGAA